MKILVTGGAGYIGSHTVKELLKKGHEVIIFDSLENGFRDAVVGGKLIEGDLRNKKDIEDVFDKHKIEAVIHFAAYASVPDSVADPAKYFENNLCGGLNLLNAMLKANVKKLVFSSTAAVYGEPKAIPIKEDDPKDPTSPYGLSKLQFEQILEWYDRAYDFRYVAVRYFCAAGADPEGQIGENHMPETHVIPMAIYTALGKREVFKIYGDDYNTPDGSGVRDFIHVVDLANIHIRALQYLREDGKSDAFNCGIKKGYSVRQIVNKVEEISGKKVNTTIEPRRAGDPATLVADPSKIIAKFDFEQKFSDLDTIIKTSWNWFAKNPDGYKE
ncbi:MAG: UDP-glucose 4-epimerase GalE [Candidatus Berkelbacteria bacterium]